MKRIHEWRKEYGSSAMYLPPEVRRMTEALPGYTFDDPNDHSVYPQVHLIPSEPCIPFTPSARAYQRYLEWDAIHGSGNTRRFAWATDTLLTPAEFGYALRWAFGMPKGKDDVGVFRIWTTRRINGEKCRGYLGLGGPDAVLVDPWRTAGRPPKKRR